MKWLSKKHVMVDIETLAGLCDAVIVSIGACKFSMNGLGIQDKFYVNVDAKSCKELGMRVDPETIEWWKKQPTETVKALQNPKPIPLTEAMTQFAEFAECDYIWCRGMFDIPILEYASKVTGVKLPYKYWQGMCHRTLTTVLDVDFNRMRQGSADHHNALGDAIAQAETVIKLFEKEPF